MKYYIILIKGSNKPYLESQAMPGESMITTNKKECQQTIIDEDMEDLCYVAEVSFKKRKFKNFISE
jgi:hypothetical protein